MRARSTKHSGSSQRGLSLVELMVAMGLALAIIAAVGYVYIQGKQGFTVQDNQSRLQENARLAVSILSRDIQMAGYFGCVKLLGDTNSAFPTSSIRITASQPILTADIGWLELDGDQATGYRDLNPGIALRGYDNGVGWQAPSGVISSRLAGTDALLILRGGDDARHLSESATETEFKIATPMTGLTADSRVRPLVISNCTRGELIKPTILDAGLRFSVDNTLNTNTASTVSDPLVENRLRGSYNTNSMIATFEPVSYYVALATGANGVQVPSLKRMVMTWNTSTPGNVGRWDNSPDVLIEGVEQFGVSYFIAGATDGTSSGPFTATQVSAASGWTSVVAVQINLTMVGDDDGVRTTQTTQTVGGTTITDQKIRLNTSFTVNIRNPHL